MSEKNEQAMEAAKTKTFQKEYHDAGLEPPRHESNMWNYGFEAGWNAALEYRVQEQSDVCRCGHDKDRHHDDVDTWCGYWNAGCDCRGYQNK